MIFKYNKNVLKYFIRKNSIKNKLSTLYNKEVITGNSLIKNENKEVVNNIEEDEELMDLVTFQDQKLNEEINDMSNKDFINNELLYKEEYDFEDKKILKRPPKKILWGLGGELLKRKKNFFKSNKKLEIEEIKKFLELELLTDIYIINFHEINKMDYTKWGFICSGYTNKHINKSARNLVDCLNGIKYKTKNKIRVHGRKDDEWIMVDIGKFASIHFMTKQTREEVMLEEKWNFKMTDEIIDELDRLHKFKKNKLLEPFKYN